VPVSLDRDEFANVNKDDQGRLFLDVPDPTPKAVLLRGATRRVASQGDTLWSLAWVAYQSLLDPEKDIRPTSFFDAIAEANDIVDPLAELPFGKVVFLPSVEVLLGEFRAPPAYLPTTAAAPGEI
jgi:hypothetical protein